MCSVARTLSRRLKQATEFIEPTFLSKTSFRSRDDTQKGKFEKFDTAIHTNGALGSSSLQHLQLFLSRFSSLYSSFSNTACQRQVFPFFPCCSSASTKGLSGSLYLFNKVRSSSGRPGRRHTDAASGLAASCDLLYRHRLIYLQSIVAVVVY